MCSGMSGVMSGDERGAADTEGETAGSMFGAIVMRALRCVVGAEDALRAETSEEDLLRVLAPGAWTSMCDGGGPRAERCWESCAPWSRARRLA